MAMETGPEATKTATFTQALASLKRRGSNLLLVGAANDHTHGEACRRFLGEDSTDRRRLFVFTDRDRCSADRPSTVAGEAAVIQYDTPTRGAAAAVGSQADSLRPHQHVSDLAGLGAAVNESIEEFQRPGDLDPADLRLCFDSLRPLLEDHDEQEMFRFVHALTSDVRSARGMGHYHLPVAFDNATVRTLSPLFDAVVEIRSHDSGPQQRWHLRDADITTDWLTL